MVGEQRVQGVEALGPEALVEAQPGRRGRKRTRVQSAEVTPALHGAKHQSCVLEHLDVPRRGGKGHFERRGEFPDRDLVPGQPPEDVTSGLVGERLEDVVHVSVKFNHVIEYTGLSAIVNTYVEYSRGRRSERLIHPTARRSLLEVASVAPETISRKNAPRHIMEKAVGETFTREGANDVCDKSRAAQPGYCNCRGPRCARDLAAEYRREVDTRRS